MSENSIEFSLSNSEQRDSWLNSGHRTLDADKSNGELHQVLPKHSPRVVLESSRLSDNTPLWSHHVLLLSLFLLTHYLQMLLLFLCWLGPCHDLAKQLSYYLIFLFFSFITKVKHRKILRDKSQESQKGMTMVTE